MDLGYSDVAYYPGGLEDWTQHGARLEAARPATPRVAEVPRSEPAGYQPVPKVTLAGRFIRRLGSLTTWQLLGVWLSVMVVCGLAYWAGNHVPDHALQQGGVRLGTSWGDFITAMYFSAVTATTLGYGDVTPHGALRAVALVESAAGLLLFGAMVSKFVSRRQEAMTEETHRLTFENRLGRVQTNLSYVIRDLQAVVSAYRDQSLDQRAAANRVESIIMIFTLELRTVYDIFYRPQQQPDAQTLEHVLASVAVSLQELQRVAEYFENENVASWRSTLADTARLATQICGECVPLSYAPSLTRWMDQIQGVASSFPQEAA